METAMAHRFPPRQPERRMARPIADRPAAEHLPALPRASPARAGWHSRGYRRWVGPAFLVMLSFLGLVPLAGLGNPAAPAAARPSSAPAVAPGASSTRAPAITPSATREPATQTTPPDAVVLPPRPWEPLPDPRKPPATAAQFDRQRQVIEIGFPLATGAGYRYRDNYGDLRPGPVEDYNHVFDVRAGRLRRAHDGIDIYAPRGTAVLAPFDGVVIDPRTRWQPWQRDRYGLTVAIVSTEPATRGYVVLLCHLDERTVRVGAHVHRGREVGTLGITGNAEDSAAQLHIELRAPFLIGWREADGVRLVDAFDPYPSLRAADPARTN